jgi:hypothetical protein
MLNKNKYYKLLFLIFFVAIFSGFGFLKVEKASAGECICSGGGTVNEENACSGKTAAALDACRNTVAAAQANADGCKNYCTSHGYFNFTFNGTSFGTNAGTGETEKKPDHGLSTANAGPSNRPEVCGTLTEISKAGMKSLITCPLLYILQFFGLLLQVAASLFNWIIKPENMNAVIDNAAIYTAWAMVRDVLNIAFILMLLFSAFATIFQVDKFSYKRILLTLVIMALLVNFSYPIARFIIDLSNVMMYYFVNALGVGNAPSGSFFVSIARGTPLGEIIYSPGVGSDVTFLIASIVFTFIFAITLLVIAVMFVIRTVALAILIIFSSLAFTGSIIPFLSTHASKWWDNLFKYAFFGPIMIFMLYIAYSMMNFINKSNLAGNMDKIAQNQSDTPGLVASVAFFSIPIVILWFGLGMAQNMSIAGASAVTGRGKKFAGWAGRTFGGAAFVSGTYKAYQARRSETQKDSWRNRLGTLVGSKQDQLRSVVGGRGGQDAALRYQRDMAQKVENEAKRNDMVNKTPDELRVLAASGDKFVRAAALQELAAKNALDASVGGKDEKDYKKMQQEFGMDSQVFKQINNKLKAYDPEAAFSHITDKTKWDNTVKAFLDSNQSDVNKFNINSLKSNRLTKAMFDNKSLSQDNILNIRKKGKGYDDALTSSVGSIASSYANPADEIHQAVQKAYTTQTGKIENAGFSENIFKTGNADSLERLDSSVIKNPVYNRLFAEQVNSGRFKKIVQNFKNNDTRIETIKFIRDTYAPPVGSAGDNGRSIKSQIDNDLYLKNI